MTTNFYFFDYDLDNSLLSMFEKDKIIELETYNLFMQSTNSHHALSASNRKFYWNSIENLRKFERSSNEVLAKIYHNSVGIQSECTLS